MNPRLDLTATTYLVRHGIAWDDDLMPEGEEQVRKAAISIQNDMSERDLDIANLVIFHSPLGRARNSAQVMQQLFADYNPTLTESQLLYDKNRLDSISTFINRIRVPTSIAISHMPQIEYATKHFGGQAITPGYGEWYRFDRNDRSAWQMHSENF